MLAISLVSKQVMSDRSHVAYIKRHENKYKPAELIPRSALDHNQRLIRLSQIFRIQLP